MLETTQRTTKSRVVGGCEGFGDCTPPHPVVHRFALFSLLEMVTCNKTIWQRVRRPSSSHKKKEMTSDTCGASGPGLYTLSEVVPLADASTLRNLEDETR